MYIQGTVYYIHLCLLMQVLYHHILSVDRQSLTTKGYPIIITTKTFQLVSLIIPRESDCTDVLHTIKQFAQPGHCGFFHCN